MSVNETKLCAQKFAVRLSLSLSVIERTNTKFGQGFIGRGNFGCVLGFSSQHCSSADMNNPGSVDFLELSEEELIAIGAVATAASNIWYFFDPDELNETDQTFVNSLVGVRDQLATLLQTPSLFKVLTNFTADEFEELASAVCPIVATHARTTGAPRSVFGRRPKLTPEQRLLHLIFYLKHDNVVRYDAYGWNWSKSSACDDAVFVSSCLNEALKDELKWPNEIERRALALTLPEFEGCIGFIDGTLIEIPRPYAETRAQQQRLWYNGRKSMYCFNNTVVVDHNGLFIFIDPGYPGSLHDVNCLRQSDLYKNWRRYFTHSDEYFEYLLGDPGYVGEDMFIMRRIGRRETVEDGEMSVIDAFNSMHAGYRVQVEWGIGGLKRKWRRLMKKTDMKHDKFPHLFRSAAIMTNFLQRRRNDMTAGVDRNANGGGGWQGDF